jgi:dipeptidyl aminopeptidase/acylaminoacyl peptidase
MTRAALALTAAAIASITIAAQQRPPVFELALVSRTGVVTRIGKLPEGTFAPRLSPDGKQIVFDTFGNTIWIADLKDISNPRRFGSGRYPMWSADGRRLLFIALDGTHLFWQPVDGSSAAELLADGARAPEYWSTTANLVTYITRKEPVDYDIWAFSPTERVPRPLIEKPTTSEMSSRFSPDGKWLAYQANDSGAFEIYVEPYPRTGARTRISDAGGERPVWTPDGREIVYDNTNTLYAASFQAAPTPRAGKPAALPIKGFIQGSGRRVWDMTPDGTQFLVLFP